MLTAIDLNVSSERRFFPCPVVLREPRAEYARLVPEFEDTAHELLAWVDEVIEEAHCDQRMVSDERWKREALFLAGELARVPWLLVNVADPDEILRQLYRAWAESCGDLGTSLRTLAENDGRRPTRIRVCYADEELAAVTAHTTARTIYLEHTLLRKQMEVSTMAEARALERETKRKKNPQAVVFH